MSIEPELGGAAAATGAFIERIAARFQRSLALVMPVGEAEADLLAAAAEVVAEDNGGGPSVGGSAPSIPGLLLVTLLAPQTWSATWYAFDIVADDNDHDTVAETDALRPMLAARREALRRALHPNGDAAVNTAMREMLAANCGQFERATGHPGVRAIGRTSDSQPWSELAEAICSRHDRPRAFGAELVLIAEGGSATRGVIDATGDLSANYGLPG